MFTKQLFILSTANDKVWLEEVFDEFGKEVHNFYQRRVSKKMSSDINF